MKRSAHRVLVTGASEFIDSHLCARLVKEGYSVRALDAAHCSWEWTFNHECNSSEATSGIKSIASGAAEGMVVIVHLAALKDVRETIKHPTLYPVSTQQGRSGS
jgi:nucleoside-diphosphate-sugar epimerase